MFISDHSNIQASSINEDELVYIDRCGMCNSTQFDRLITYSKKPNINFVRCLKCGAVTYDRILNQDAIDKLYASDEQYYKDDTSEESGGNITFYGSERFAKHLLRKSRITRKKQYRILDFGGGDGELAYAVAKELYRKFRFNHADITVVDYTNSLYNTKNKRVSMTSVFPLSSINEAQWGYDIIIASGVIEHIPNPGEDIKRLFEMLSPNGIIYFRTPYIYPLRRDLSRLKIEYDTLFPAHIWDLGMDWYKDLPKHVGYKGRIKTVCSEPSIVEKSFKSHFFIALASYALKAPWFIIHKWPYVGGWEAIYKKI